MIQHATPYVIIVIPCYNEAHRLAVEPLVSFQLLRHRVELLFVNDGSRDGTLQVLEAMHMRAPRRIGVVSLIRNSGKAEAVRQGVVQALKRSPDYIGFWDADLATPLAEIPSFCEVLDTRHAVQMVLGSRVKLMGRVIDRKAYRHYFGRILATAASLCLDLPIYDTQCGAKLFRVGDILRQVFDTPFLSRWMFDVEIIARSRVIMAAQGIEASSAIYELPLTEWHDAAGSKVHLTDAVQAFVDLAKIQRIYRRKWLPPRNQCLENNNQCHIVSVMKR